MNNSTVIYKDDNPMGARMIWITLNNGDLYMTSQDISPELEKFFGRDTYERFLTGIPIVDLRNALNASSDDHLISIIKDKFGVNSGFDDFRDFLSENNIHFNYGSY